MTAAVSISAYQGRFLVAVHQNKDINVFQARLFAAYRIPAVSTNVFQARFQAGVHQNKDINVWQARFLVAGQGKIDNRRLRAWTFTLDAHDFYVLRLGENSTIVWDNTTQSWSKFQDPTYPTWRAHLGVNWTGMGYDSLLNACLTNIVAGDADEGYLWTLNPYQGYDEGTDLSQNTFTREVIGGVPMRTRKTQPVGAAYLTVNSGDPEIANSSFDLQTSTDNGNTWHDHGAIVSESSDFSQQFAWRSLGQIKAPGMAFKITDNGAAVRIDSLEIR